MSEKLKVALIGFGEAGAAFAEGFADSLDNKKPRLEGEELESVVQNFHAHDVTELFQLCIQ